MKIVPVQKTVKFWQYECVNSGLMHVQISCLSMSLNHRIAVFIRLVQPMLQFSIYLSMISIESIWGSLLLGASLLSEGRYF